MAEQIDLLKSEIKRINEEQVWCVFKQEYVMARQCTTAYRVNTVKLVNIVLSFKKACKVD